MALWLPTSEAYELAYLAKQEAKASTRLKATPQTQLPRMRLPTHNIARKQDNARKVPEKVGNYFERVNC